LCSVLLCRAFAEGQAWQSGENSRPIPGAAQSLPTGILLDAHGSMMEPSLVSQTVSVVLPAHSETRSSRNICDFQLALGRGG